MGSRQKTAIYKPVGPKVPHSTQSSLNTLLFRREPWKGRTTPTGVTNGSMLGTVNPNKLVRVTSKYFRPLSPEQVDKDNRPRNSDVDWWNKASTGRTSFMLRSLQATSCAGSTWGHHDSLHCDTMKKEMMVSPFPRTLLQPPGTSTQADTCRQLEEESRRHLGLRRAEGTGFGQCLSRRMLGLPKASVVPVLCSLMADVYPELTNSSWKTEETKAAS